MSTWEAFAEVKFLGEIQFNKAILNYLMNEFYVWLMKEIFYDKGYRRNRRPVGWIDLGPGRQPDFTPRSLSCGQLGFAHLVALLHFRDLRLSHSLCRRP